MTMLGEAELKAVGRALGRELPPGSVVWLSGELGAGKTTLAKEIAAGLGVAGATSSPSYALVNRYPGRLGPVYHVDCYRLRHPDEAADLDWESMTRGAALLIEWPEKAGPYAPRPAVHLRLAHGANPDHREVRGL